MSFFPTNLSVGIKEGSSMPGNPLKGSERQPIPGVVCNSNGSDFGNLGPRLKILSLWELPL
jgi:hypothetical protein